MPGVAMATMVWSMKVMATANSIATRARPLDRETPDPVGCEGAADIGSPGVGRRGFRLEILWPRHLDFPNCDPSLVSSPGEVSPGPKVRSSPAPVATRRRGDDDGGDDGAHHHPDLPAVRSGGRGDLHRPPRRDGSGPAGVVALPRRPPADLR